MSMPTKDVTQGVVATIADDALVMVANGSQWSPIKFSDLAKAVRGTLQVGGRNYFKNSSIFTKTAESASAYVDIAIGSLKAGDSVFIGYDKVEVLAGTFNRCTVVLRDAKTSSNIVIGYLNIASNELFITSDIAIQDAHIYLYIGTPSYTLGNSIRFTNLMVAKSNVRASWSPAPEDIASGNWGGGNCKIFNYLRLLSERRCA